MTGHDAASQTLLDNAERILCATQTQRDILQQVYDMGVQDGQIKALDEQIAKMEVKA
jgi:hypothetical protein